MDIGLIEEVIEAPAPVDVPTELPASAPAEKEVAAPTPERDKELVPA